MSTLVQTYLEFESRESFLRHLTPAYIAAKDSGHIAFFLSAVYLKWLQAFPQDALDGLIDEKYHGKHALVPVYPDGALSTCPFLDIIKATLLSVLTESRVIVIELLDCVPEGIVLEQEQRLIDFIQSLLELLVKVGGPYIKCIPHGNAWVKELGRALCSWMVYNRLPTSMLAAEDALKLPPPYDCYVVEPPCTLLTLIWRHPTPGLDHIDVQDDIVFLGLKSDWKDEVRALHAQFPRTHDSDGSSADSLNEASESLCDDDSGGDESDDDDYNPPSDCSDEEDHYFDVDDGEIEPWGDL